MTMLSTGRGVTRRFESQFEDDGLGGYQYRLNGKGPAIHVSAEERSRFVTQFVTRAYLSQGVMVAASSTLFFAFIYRRVSSATHPTEDLILSNPLFYAGIAVTILPTLALTYWFWWAPARALKGRAVLGPERAKDEVRALNFRRMTYGRLAITALLGAWSYEYIAKGEWDRHWVFMPPLIVTLAVVQAFRKWRFERAHPDLR